MWPEVVLSAAFGFPSRDFGKLKSPVEENEPDSF